MGLRDNNKTKFTRRDIAYYLDAQLHDAADRDGVSRKNARFFALRERLVRLSDEQFDVAMRAIEGIVNSAHAPNHQNEIGQKPMSDEEMREFADLAKKSGGNATGSSVKQISRI